VQVRPNILWFSTLTVACTAATFDLPLDARSCPADEGQ
jgi:hypothetical protein